MEVIELQPANWAIKNLLQVDKHATGHTIIIRHGHIAIANYKLGDNPRFEKYLSVWNEMYWRYEVVGFYYVKQFKELRLNRNFNLRYLCSSFPDAEVKVDLHPFESDEIDVLLLTPPRDDIQKLCMTFLAAMTKYEYLGETTQRFIRLRPGSGKTYSLCTATAFFRAKTVVIMPMSVLLKQWKDSYMNFTDIKEKEILIVKGSKKCEEIRQGLHQDKKVFLFLIDTLVSYHDIYGDMKTMEMLEATHAYLMGIDECHLNFKALSMVLAMQNFPMTVYLTASPDRTERRESQIYKTVFAGVPQFGEDVFTKDEKYLNVIIKEYHFTPNHEQVARINTKMGMNTKLYESELINSDERAKEDFDNSVIQMLKWAKTKIRKEDRMLLLANTIEGAEYLKTLCDKVFEENESASYYGTMNKTLKEEAKTKRIICATASSCGTGFDMPGMTVCMNILSYSSKVMATQLSGRVRKPKSGPAIYIEFVNVAYHKCYNQFKSRKSTLADQVPNGKLLVIR